MSSGVIEDSQAKKWSRIAARTDRIAESLSARQAPSNAPRVESYKQLVKTLSEKKSVLDLLKPSKSESLDGESVAIYQSFSASSMSQKVSISPPPSRAPAFPVAAAAPAPTEPPRTVETPTSLTFSATNSPLPPTKTASASTTSSFSSNSTTSSSSTVVSTLPATVKETTEKPTTVSSVAPDAASVVVPVPSPVPEKVVEELKPVVAAKENARVPAPKAETQPAPVSTPAPSTVPVPAISPSKSAPASISSSAPIAAASAPTPVSPVQAAATTPHTPHSDGALEEGKKMSVDDFESLAIIGRGAFGEVRLVRRKDSNDREVYGKNRSHINSTPWTYGCVFLSDEINAEG